MSASERGAAAEVRIVPSKGRAIAKVIALVLAAITALGAGLIGGSLYAMSFPPVPSAGQMIVWFLIVISALLVVVACVVTVVAIACRYFELS